MSSDPRPKIYGLTTEDPEIFHALEDGDVERLKALLEHDRACVNARMGDPDQTPLMMAARMGREDLFELLLAAGATVAATNRFGQTALQFAVEVGNERIAMRLLESGASVHPSESRQDGPLHIAAQNCGPNMVEALLRAGADVDAKRYNESTPAIMAAFFGRTDNIRVLAAHGADIVGARGALNTGGPYDYCLTIASNGGHQELLHYLLASYSWPSQVMNVALKHAARHGHLEIVQSLVASGADPFAPAGANNKSAFERARQKKQQAVVDYFKTLRSPRRGRAQ